MNDQAEAALVVASILINGVAFGVILAALFMLGWSPSVVLVVVPLVAIATGLHLMTKDDR